MAKNNRYISKQELKELDIGKINTYTVPELQALWRQLGGTTYNRLQKFTTAEEAGNPISSLAKGKLEQYMRGREYLHKKDGKLTFALPDTGYKVYGLDQYGAKVLKRSQSYKNTLISDIKVFYNFLTSEGSTVTGARRIAKDTAIKLGFDDEPSQDMMDNLWGTYEEFRAEIESISEGSPVFQKFIASLYKEGVNREEVESALYVILKDGSSKYRYSASNTDEQNKQLLKDLFNILTGNKYGDKVIGEGPNARPMVDEIADKWFDKGVKV